MDTVSTPTLIAFGFLALSAIVLFIFKNMKRKDKK